MTQPISSVYGEITRMLLTFPGQEVLPNDIVLQRYKGIFDSLGTNIQYVILAHENVHESIKITASNSGLATDTNIALVGAFSNYPAFVQKILRHIGGNVYECELENSWHSIWAQDGYSCVKNDAGATVLLEPLDFTRYGDHFVAEQVAAVSDLEIEVTKYHLEGGNILAGDNYVIIGIDYLHYNKSITGESETDITNSFKKLFGVDQVIWLGFDVPVNFPIHVWQGKYQPIFHIDMYVTLGGKTASGKELVFVADARLAKKELGESAPPLVIADAFDKTSEFFDNYSKEGLEFEVERIPIDLWNVDTRSGTFLTYNNCLIEVFGQEKNVFLPAYSSVAPGSRNRKKLDEKVAKIFDDKGFTVKLLEGSYEELCKNGGSIHCITKALDRKTL